MTKPHTPVSRHAEEPTPYDPAPPFTARQAGALALVGAAIMVALVAWGIVWDAAGLPILDEPAAEVDR